MQYNNDASKLREILDKHPALMFQNKGYEYIDRRTLSEDDMTAIKEVESICRKHIPGFVKFLNFCGGVNGEIKVRVRYHWDVSFVGVGYFPLSDFNEDQAVMEAL